MGMIRGTPTVKKGKKGLLPVLVKYILYRDCGVQVYKMWGLRGPYLSRYGLKRSAAAGSQ